MTSLTIKNDWRLTFLEALYTHGVITHAAKQAGISRQMAYLERQHNEWFAKEWDAALERGIDALEDAAKVRAFEGSDTLLIFLLKSRRREIYGDVSRQVRTNVQVDWEKVPTSTRDDFIEGRITLDDVLRSLT